MDKLKQLQDLRQSGQFHHATYRNFGTLWEGLWIYKKDGDGFTPAFAFFKHDAALPAAEAAVRGTGVSVGAYGHG